MKWTHVAEGYDDCQEGRCTIRISYVSREASQMTHLMVGGSCVSTRALNK